MSRCGQRFLIQVKQSNDDETLKRQIMKHVELQVATFFKDITQGNKTGICYTRAS